jgi:hypothetical protein
LFQFMNNNYRDKKKDLLMRVYLFGTLTRLI